MTEKDSTPAEEPRDDVETAPDAPSPRQPEGAGLSPALIATLVAIPAMVIAVFIVFAVFKNNEQVSTPVDSYATVEQDAAACGPLIQKLPESFGDFGGREIDGDTVRWTSSVDGADGDPLVFKCGVARPEALAPTSALQVINPTQWFITDTDEERGQAYVLVDRRPYVAVWVPKAAGNGPLTDISGLMAQLPAAPLDFGDN